MLTADEIGLMAKGTIRGEVIDFDDAAGTGWLGVSGTDNKIFFHCTQLLDGTRQIETGCQVYSQIVFGHTGKFEAANIVKCDY